MTELTPEQKLAKIRVVLGYLEKEIVQAKAILKGESQTTAFCGQCGHWKGRCLKGYVCRQNGMTIACREFIEGKAET